MNQWLTAIEIDICDNGAISTQNQKLLAVLIFFLVGIHRYQE